MWYYSTSFDQHGGERRATTYAGKRDVSETRWKEVDTDKCAASHSAGLKTGQIKIGPSACATGTYIEAISGHLQQGLM